MQIQKKSNRLLFILFSLSIFLSTETKSQSFKGQWIGGFSSGGDLSGGKTDYIIEIETEGKQITGYSYTYFSISGKRYYVICKLEGNFDKGSKSLVINEVETYKTNTPPDFKNCLQSHQLTYFKQKDKELLLGKWKPTTKGSDCGKGETALERKQIAKIPAEKKSNSITENSKLINSPNNVGIDKKKPISIPLLNQKATPDLAKEPKISQNEIPTTTPLIKVDTKSNQEEVNSSKKISNKEREKLTERTQQFIKTIDVSGSSFKVDIYDNGQVDGDTVTIFLNEKLLIPSKKLTTSPITIEVKIEDDEDVYDLIMYAESLGTIPPNTALMIVTTSTNRYEINITSTEQTSGAIRFKVKR